MTSFDLRRLRYFLVTADLGSLTRAAEELHVAQPALSYQIHQLEDELGAQLFIRGSQGVRLTEAGCVLALEARALLAGVRQSRDRITESLSSVPQGVVHFGLSQSIAGILVIPLLQRVAEELPNVRVNIRELMSADSAELVRAEAIDFAISYDYGRDSGVSVRHLLTEAQFLVGTKQLARYFLGARSEEDEISIAEVAELPLYLSGRRDPSRDLLEEFARRKHGLLNIVAQVNLTTTRRDIAQKGLGFTILSGASLGDPSANTDLYFARVSDDRFNRRASLIMKTDAHLSRATKLVAQLACDELLKCTAHSFWPGCTVTSLLHELAYQIGDALVPQP